MTRAFTDCGQLATIFRARYCEPKITSFTKTDGLTFRVKEILDGVFKGKSFLARDTFRAKAPMCSIMILRPKM